MSKLVTLRLTQKQKGILIRWLIRNIAYIDDVACDFRGEGHELRAILDKLEKGRE